MDNPFKGLQNILGIFARGGASAVGVDIGSSAIKVVQLRKHSGRAVLETYGELALGPYGGAEVGNAVKLPLNKMAEALVDVLREAKVTSKECGIAIPISASLVTLIELPLVDEKHLAEMVPIEARKYIPVPISEVVMDWWVIPKEATGVSYPFGGQGSAGAVGKDFQQGRMVDVLLAVIHNEAVSRFQDVVKAAGLVSSFYEIEIFSTIRATFGTETEPVMIMDMGAATTKLYIVDHGIVKSSHVINRGSQDITLSLSRALNTSVKEAELLKRNIGLDTTNARRDVTDVVGTTLSYILSEASRLIVNHEKKGGQRLGKVILTGGGVLLKGFHDFAQNFFETPVAMADSFAKAESPAFLRGVLQKAGPEFAVAIGLALRKLQELP